MPPIIDPGAEATPAHAARASNPRETAVRPTRVALVGAHGHGASHLRRIAGLADRGIADLCAVADPRPPDALKDAPPNVPWYSSLEELLATEATTPDVVAVSYTHL